MMDISVSDEALADMIAGMPVYPNAIVVNNKKLRALKKAFTQCLGIGCTGLSVGGLILVGNDEIEAKTCKLAHIGD